MSILENVIPVAAALSRALNKLFGTVELGGFHSDGGTIAILCKNKYTGRVFVSLSRNPELFSPMNFADNLPRLSINVRNGVWNRLVDYSTDRSSRRPHGFELFPIERRVAFSLDGQMFSIPIEDLKAIDEFIRGQVRE